MSQETQPHRNAIHVTKCDGRWSVFLAGMAIPVCTRDHKKDAVEVAYAIGSIEDVDVLVFDAAGHVIRRVGHEHAA